MNAPQQVYIVTSGDYSDYRIDSVWFTLEEAEAAKGNYGSVEIYPVGRHTRTLGTFSRNADVDYTTGEVTEHEPSSWAAYPPDHRAAVCCWPGSRNYYRNKLGIRVTADTQERADKVYSEVRARVLAGISSGLPLELIATEFYNQGTWQPTVGATGSFELFT